MTSISRSAALGTGVAQLKPMDHGPTISFEKPTSEDRFRVLPPGASVEEIVRLARASGLAFLSGGAFGWGRHQLRSWLHGDYAAATAWTRMDPGPLQDPTLGLDDPQVGELVARTRSRVIRMLDHARTTWKAPTFARDMIDGRVILCVYDRSALQAYAPAAHASMDLIDRVASLFVADYLVRPSDYELIVSCEACGQVTIGRRDDHPSWCAEPPEESGLVGRGGCAKSERPTMKGLG